jgi:hypothetical protein
MKHRKQIKRLCRINNQINRFKSSFRKLYIIRNGNKLIWCEAAKALPTQYGLNLELELTQLFTQEILTELYNGDKEQYIKEFPIVADYLTE